MHIYTHNYIHIYICIYICKSPREQRLKTIYHLLSSAILGDRDCMGFPECMLIFWKNMSSSVGMMTFPSEWKVIIQMFQTTNQYYIF